MPEPDGLLGGVEHDRGNRAADFLERCANCIGNRDGIRAVAMDTQTFRVEFDERAVVCFDLARFDIAAHLRGGERHIRFVLFALQDQRTIGRVDQIRVDFADDAVGIAAVVGAGQ